MNTHRVGDIAKRWASARRIVLDAIADERDGWRREDLRNGYVEQVAAIDLDAEAVPALVGWWLVATSRVRHVAAVLLLGIAALLALLPTPSAEAQTVVTFVSNTGQVTHITDRLVGYDGVYQNTVTQEFTTGDNDLQRCNGVDHQ